MDDAVREIVGSLKISGRRRAAIARELQTHLEEERRDLELCGYSPEEARREVLVRLGNPQEIADGFTRVHRMPRRSRALLAFGLASALAMGAFGVGGTLASAGPARHTHAQQIHPTARPANRVTR